MPSSTLYNCNQSWIGHRHHQHHQHHHHHHLASSSLSSSSWSSAPSNLCKRGYKSHLDPEQAVSDVSSKPDYANVSKEEDICWLSKCLLQKLFYESYRRQKWLNTSDIGCNLNDLFHPTHLIFCKVNQQLILFASGGNWAMRHGWKSNYIIRKVDGNQTNLDGIPTKHRKQHSWMDFHVSKLKNNILFLFE